MHVAGLGVPQCTLDRREHAGARYGKPDLDKPFVAKRLDQRLPLCGEVWCVRDQCTRESHDTLQRRSQLRVLAQQHVLEHPFRDPRLEGFVHDELGARATVLAERARQRRHVVGRGGEAAPVAGKRDDLGEPQEGARGGPHDEAQVLQRDAAAPLVGCDAIQDQGTQHPRALQGTDPIVLKPALPPVEKDNGTAHPRQPLGEPMVVRALLPILLVALAASPAQATEIVQGDGFAIQVPIGYERVDVKGAAASDAMAQVEAILPSKGSLESQVFFKGDQLAPEGTVIVTRAAMAHGLEADAVTLIEERLADRQRDLGVPGKATLQRRTVSGYEGVELSVRGVLGAGKDGRHLHLLVVPGGSFVMSVLMIHKPTGAGLASDDWADMLGTFDLHAPHEALQRVVTWGGISLAALFVLLLLIRLMRGGPGGRRVDFSRAGEALLTGPSAYEGTTMSGVTRAHDGLPVFHGSASTSRPTPGGSPAANFVPERRSGNPSAPGLPGLKPTLGNNQR